MKILKSVVIISLLFFAVSCQNSGDFSILAFLGLDKVFDSDESNRSLNSIDPESGDPVYEVGTGMGDVTGPAAEVMFAGYCDFEQKGTGIFMRQRSRAFIIRDMRNSNSVVLVTVEIPLMSTGVYVEVLKKLKSQFGNLYNEKNVVMSVTHTHSGPGGYFKTYALNIFAGMTFHQGNFSAIVNGIFDSIVMAHNRLAPGRVFLNSGEFSNKKFERVNRQRSEEAYYLNRDAGQYLLPDGTPDDTNRRMTQLKLIKEDGTEIGMYNWAPIHPNTGGSHLSLINGDVNGYVSYLAEKEKGTDYINNNEFIAAFAYNDSADTSSNLPEDVLLPQFSGRAKTVVYDNNGTVVDWIADGSCDYERMELRAKSVHALAKDLYDTEGIELTGTIESRQLFAAAQSLPIKPEFINDADIYYGSILNESKSNRALCSGAAGVGFFAGSTEDGDSGMVAAGEGNPRDVRDYQISSLGDLISDPIPSIADILLHTLVPGQELYDEMDCQLEKRMTLNFDELDNLIPGGKAWNLNQPFQIIKIGDFAVVALPFEVTTMAGRRIKAEVKSVLPDVNNVCINSTSNSDLRYLTTREEYASQQYEGGATLMGPYSLNAVRQIVNELAQTFTPGVSPPSYAVDLSVVEDGLEKKSILQLSGVVVFDDKPLDKNFGDIYSQPGSAYSKGQKVSAVFWGAHPNNNLTVKSHESFLIIEKKSGSRQECHDETHGCDTETVCETINTWEPVLYDWDPSTRYRWKRNGVANSHVTIEWLIPADMAPGEYRIKHIGNWKSGWTGQISRYEGASRSFIVQ